MHIAVIGGGTGTRAVLEALRHESDVELTAIVAMADNGGSTGTLRRELGVLPAGDLRQCLVALSTLPPELKALLEHRFDRGSVNGHPMGNLLIAAAQARCGDMEEALCLMKALLQVQGDVVPVTISPVDLKVAHGNGRSTVGEIDIVRTTLEYPRECQLVDAKTGEPSSATLSDSAARALRKADLIIIGPGNVYGSLIPNFLVSGMQESIRRAKAKLVYFVNLMTSPGHTDGWDASTYTQTIEEYAGQKMDVILVNDQALSEALSPLVPSGASAVRVGALEGDPRLVSAHLLDMAPILKRNGDPLVRNRIRHDPHKIAPLFRRLFLTRR